MIRPPRLRPGGVVRIVAPSGPVPREAFLAGLELLRARYDVRWDEATIFARSGFLAGPDEQRLPALLGALTEPDVDAVMMARGGYGLLRLLPFLRPEVFMLRPRPLVGFSDGTALIAAAARGGLVSIHGPVVTQLANLSTDDQRSLYERLETPGPALLLDGLEEIIPGRARGPLLGGNLELFSRLVGTPYLPDLDGAILFFEDLGERPYRIDRLITHLDLAGVFSAASAVVLGDFSSCREPEPTRAESPTAEEVLVERFGRLPIPVVRGGAFGHGTRNVALPYGALAELDTRTGTLVTLEGAVELSRRSLADHRARRGHGIGLFDLAEALLVAAQVVLEGAQQALGVSRRRDDPGADPRARRGRLDVGEVEDELVVVVVDEHEVRVGPLRDRVVDVDLHLWNGGVARSFRMFGHAYGIQRAHCPGLRCPPCLRGSSASTSAPAGSAWRSRTSWG